MNKRITVTLDPKRSNTPAAPLAPRKKGKNAAPKRARPARTGKPKRAGRAAGRERTELELLRSYRERLAKLGVEDERVGALDLENEFYWLFRLSGLIARAYRTFDEVNTTHFEGALPRPKIIYCDRSSGGYYHRPRHTIGLSLAMTVEFGEDEFNETLLHEIAHITELSHGPKFYEILRRIGGTGRKAPLTLLLSAKRKHLRETKYPVVVRCPGCLKVQRYRTKRALQYACRPCCMKHNGGKFDPRFRFVLATSSDDATA